MKIVFLFFVVVFCFNSYAQNNKIGFESGFIVLTNGDTVRGELKRFNEYKSCKKVKFLDTTGKVTNYSPSHLKSYERKDVVYETKRKAGLRSNVFMKSLLNGKLNLYEYNYQSFIVVHAGMVPIPVIIDHTVLYVQKGDTMTKITKSNFKKVMGEMVSDNSNLSGKIMDKELKYEDIYFVVNSFNMNSH